MSFESHFAKNIRNLRLQKGITQGELAAAIGVQKQTIYKYESGIVTNIPPSKIQALAAFFQVPENSITGWRPTIQFTDPARIDTVLCYKMKRYYKKEDFFVCTKQLSKDLNIPVEEIRKVNNGYLEADVMHLSHICNFFNLPADIIWMKVYVPSDDEIFTDEEERESANVLLEDCTQMIIAGCYNRLFQRCAEDGIHVKILDDFINIVHTHSKLQIQDNTSAPKINP